MDATMGGKCAMTGTEYPAGTAIEMHGGAGWRIARPSPEGEHSTKCRTRRIGVLFGDTSCNCWLRFLTTEASEEAIRNG